MFDKILVAVDHSEVSDRALDAARDLALLSRGEVWVLHLREREVAVKTGVALSDGGAGLEDFLRVQFPRVAAVILDFYHASEYLAKVSAALHPADDAAALAQTMSWSHVLREEGGAAMHHHGVRTPTASIHQALRCTFIRSGAISSGETRDPGRFPLRRRGPPWH